MFPRLNLLSLDMDAGSSEVNILNRLHFMVAAAREQAAHGEETMPETAESRRFVMSNMWPRELEAFNNYASLEVEKWRAWVSGLELWEKVQNIKDKIGW
jgi:hypothetical protein